MAEDFTLAERLMRQIDKAALEARNIFPNATDDEAHAIESFAIFLQGVAARNGGRGDAT